MQHFGESFAPILYFKVIDRANNIVPKGQVWPIITDESTILLWTGAFAPKNQGTNMLIKRISR